MRSTRVRIVSDDVSDAVLDARFQALGGEACQESHDDAEKDRSPQPRIGAGEVYGPPPPVAEWCPSLLLVFPAPQGRFHISGQSEAHKVLPHFLELNVLWHEGH